MDVKLLDDTIENQINELTNICATLKSKITDESGNIDLAALEWYLATSSRLTNLCMNAKNNFNF